MRGILVALLTASLLGVIPARAAQAACAYDPDALTFREMISQGTTGKHAYPVMFLGKVVSVKDKGKPGGEVIATLAVAAHPVGSASLVSRVRFYKPPRGVSAEDNFVFHKSRRYVVIGKRVNGPFASDGGCGQTAAVGKTKFLNLVKASQSGRGAAYTSQQLLLGARWVRQRLLV